MMKYFTIEELCESEEAKRRGISNHPSGMVADRIHELIENALDSIRETWGSAIHVNSGFRSAALNAAIKGSSSTSAHVTGYAADIVPVNGLMSAFQQHVLAWSETHAFDQIIIEYPNDNGTARWIHIGYKNATGMQRRQVLYTTNGRDYKTVQKGSKFWGLSPTLP